MGGRSRLGFSRFAVGARSRSSLGLRSLGFVRFGFGSLLSFRSLGFVSLGIGSLGLSLLRGGLYVGAGGRGREATVAGGGRSRLDLLGASTAGSERVVRQSDSEAAEC